MSRYKQKKPVLFFQKPVYRFAASCEIRGLALAIFERKGRRVVVPDIRLGS